MAFGEVYTSMQTGVVDGYEHDANTTVNQHFYEVARYMAHTGHIAGVLILSASARTLARLPPDIRSVVERSALEAAAYQRARGPAEDAKAHEQLRGFGMTIREFDRAAFRPAAERLWSSEADRLNVKPWLEAILA